MICEFCWYAISIQAYSRRQMLGFFGKVNTTLVSPVCVDFGCFKLRNFDNQNVNWKLFGLFIWFSIENCWLFGRNDHDNMSTFDEFQSNTSGKIWSRLLIEIPQMFYERVDKRREYIKNLIWWRCFCNEHIVWNLLLLPSHLSSKEKHSLQKWWYLAKS